MPELLAALERAAPQTIGRDAFFDALGSQDALARHARVMPSVKDDAFNGFKFYGIRPDSPPEQLGLRNGDMLIAIDGRPVRPEMAWLQEMTAAAADGEVALTVVRKGEALPFVFQLVDASAAAAP